MYKHRESLKTNVIILFYHIQNTLLFFGCVQKLEWKWWAHDSLGKSTKPMQWKDQIHCSMFIAILPVFVISKKLISWWAKEANKQFRIRMLSLAIDTLKKAPRMPAHIALQNKHHQILSILQYSIKQANNITLWTCIIIITELGKIQR